MVLLMGDSLDDITLCQKRTTTTTMIDLLEIALHRDYDPKVLQKKSASYHAPYAIHQVRYLLTSFRLRGQI